MRLVPLFLALPLLLFCRPVSAGQKSVTYYLDAARVEQEVTAPGGYLEFTLPGSIAPGSLRVKPLRGGAVLRVELAQAEPDRSRRREIARLEERKDSLQVRMQALSAREEIFTAAAKSQSGKAPRKSKSNPDPLVSLQQGTEFALERLDAVLGSKRRTQAALDQVERELAQARKKTMVARIWLTGRRAAVSYLLTSERWSPCYDFRWSGSDATGELLLHARLPRGEKGVRYLVSRGKAGEEAAAQKVSGSFPTLSRYPLVLHNGAGGTTVPASFSFDPVEPGLPPGEAAIYWRGEYLGSGRFAGGSSAEVAVLRE